MSSGIVIIIKDSETRQYTAICQLRKKKLSFSLFIFVIAPVGLWPLITT
jgi:hypothetical protein